MASCKCYTKETIKYCETWEKKENEFQWGSKIEVTRWKMMFMAGKSVSTKGRELFFSVYEQKKVIDLSQGQHL